jgi:orotate phosphoribosyltransferase
MANSIITNLIQIKAIKLSLATPFKWASGWNSPIYCDNRQTLSYPLVRKQISDAFANFIREKYPQAQVVAGVATGAIAHAAFVASALDMPMVYVRPEAKKHGLTNQVEGYLQPKQKVVVIEDLISTGGSSLAAVEALRAAGADVLGMVAIFSYGFDVAANNFDKAGVTLNTLANYHELIEQAVDMGIVDVTDLQVLRQWRENPEAWG